MRLAKKYKNWLGPYTLDNFEKLSIKEDSIIWYPALCSNNLQEPFNCDHSPLVAKDFKGLKSKPKEQIFYKELNQHYLIQKIVFWTALMGLFTGIVTLAKQIVSKESGIIICNKCDCNCEYEDVKGEANGKRALFRIAYLTQEKKWKFENESELNDGSLLSDNIKQNLPKFPNFSVAQGIVCVGTASQEGDKEKEELRADRRADAILFNVRINTISSDKELYKLNLGQYRGDRNLSTTETDYQRRVILVGIMEKDSKMNFDELKTALKNGLNDSKGLDYNTERYSKFQLTREN